MIGGEGCHEIREQPSYCYFFFDPHYMYSFHLCLTMHNMVKMTIDTDEETFLPFESFQRVCKNDINHEYKYTRVMCII